jgi:hypothetical protein
MPISINDTQHFSLPEISAMIKVPHMTLYRWARKGETSDGHRLQVVRDSLSRQYYMSKSSVDDLAERYDPKRRYKSIA